MNSSLRKSRKSIFARRDYSLIVCAIAFIALSSQALADVRISNMDNLSLPAWSGSGDVEDEDEVCIYNDADTSYQITATGSGGGGAFVLIDGAKEINYEVAFQGSVGGFTSLSNGSGQSFSVANQVSDTCGGSTNATLRVRVTEAELRGAQAGSYTGTLYVEVAPN